MNSVAAPSVCHIPAGAGTELLRLVLDLGAAHVGGPLTPAEIQLLESAGTRSPVSETTLADVRRATLAGEDPLGDLSCRSRSTLERRGLGAFYTPPSIVKPMVEWVLDRKPARVVDAGCGSGRFAAEIARRSPTTELLAVDLDPLATLMTRDISVLARRWASPPVTSRVADDPGGL